MECIGNASLEFVQYLVEQYPDSVKVKDDEGLLPLHHACFTKTSLEVIRYLVEQCPDSIKGKICTGIIPLHCALEASLEVVQFLVRTYPESIKEPDNYEETPLALFARSKNKLKDWMSRIGRCGFA